jgi:hypothetical protein
VRVTRSCDNLEDITKGPLSSDLPRPRRVLHQRVIYPPGNSWALAMRNTCSRSRTRRLRNGPTVLSATQGLKPKTAYTFPSLRFCHELAISRPGSCSCDFSESRPPQFGEPLPSNRYLLWRTSCNPHENPLSPPPCELRPPPFFIIPQSYQVLDADIAIIYQPRPTSIDSYSFSLLEYHRLTYEVGAYRFFFLLSTRDSSDAI